MAPVAVVPVGYFFLWNSHFFLFKSRRGAPNCSDFRGRSRRHRIAFNSLYLFSSKSIIYKAKWRRIVRFTRGDPISSSLSGGLRVLPVFPVHARKHPGGVASMTRDRGYPDWLVLSARLLWAGYHSTKYLCFIMFSCGYVKILQPVAICSYFRNTRSPGFQSPRHIYGSGWESPDIFTRSPGFQSPRHIYGLGWESPDIFTGQGESPQTYLRVGVRVPRHI